MKAYNTLAILISLVLLLSCATVPLLDRRQVLLVPQSQMLSMSQANYRGFIDTVDISYNQIKVDEVRNVGRNISDAVEDYFREEGLEVRISQFEWEFNLIDDPTVNAWCMPGGKIVFYEGILPLCENDDGIAVVMGHEIGHAVARHGNERMSQQLMVMAGGIALAEFMNEKPEQTQQIFMSAYAIGSQLGVLLPFSRKHEYEADKLGLIFMAKAGYDPEEAIGFWERMMNNGGPKPPDFLSTHPADQKRIDHMKELLPEAKKYYESSKTGVIKKP